MRRTLCWINAADACCVARGSYKLSCDLTPTDCKTVHTVRNTGVNSVNLPVCAFIEVHTEGLQDRTQCKSFRNISFRAAGSWDLECSEFDPTSLKISAPFSGNFTHVPRCRAYILKYFISSCCWIPKFSQITRITYLVKTRIRRPFIYLGHELHEATRRYRWLRRRIARSGAR